LTDIDKGNAYHVIKEISTVTDIDIRQSMKTRPLGRIQKTLDVLRHQGANIRDLHVLSCLIQVRIGPRHGPRALREDPAHKHLTLCDIRAADCCPSISRDRTRRRAPGKTRLNVKLTKLLHQGQPNVKCLKKRITSCPSYSCPKQSQRNGSAWALQSF
jgi:hypothetical protein